jgi:hypothetical protein
MEAIRSSETSVYPSSTQRHIPEDNILHRHHCESPQIVHNIKIDLREMGWDGMDWIDLADRDQWRALVNTVMNLRVP